eukprot:9293090-Prorocentrum_lima.AAC.1
MVAPAAAMLIAEAQAAALRLIASRMRVHYQGLEIASRKLRGRIPSRLQRQLRTLDAAASL